MLELSCFVYCKQITSYVCLCACAIVCACVYENAHVYVFDVDTSQGTSVHYLCRDMQSIMCVLVY